MRNMCSQNVRHFPHVHFIVHYFKVPSLAFIVPAHIVHIALHTKNNSNNKKKNSLIRLHKVSLPLGEIF